jgi:hypothetical protein
VSLTGGQFALTFDLPSGDDFWRVRARNSLNQMSNWSPAWKIRAP